MLLLPLDGTLFQLAYRDPELLPLFQLPPRMTALPSSPIYFGTFQAFNPAAKHGANFANKCLRNFLLMLSD